MASKKAQIQSQIFIYVFAVIVISLTLIFGIKIIFDFIIDMDEVAIVNFQTELKTITSSVASEYGSIQKTEIILPKKFKQVCFTDNLTRNYVYTITNIMIKDSVNSNSSSNVFIIKDINDVEEFKTSVKLSVNYANNYLCVNNTDGKIRVTITGKSKFAEISP